MKANRREVFFQHPKNAPAITAEALPSIVRQYEQRYGIKVYVNGETDFGQGKIKAREAAYDKLIHALEDEKTKYAVYLMHFWEHGNSSISLGEYRVAFACKDREETMQCLALISSYFDEYKKFRKDLSIEEIQALNKNILENFPPIKNVINKSLDKVKAYLIEKQKDEGLPEDECVQEVLHIQKSLVDNQVVGYFTTNGHRVSEDHFEVLIITKDNICRPADWTRGIPGKMIDFKNQGYFANAKIEPLVTSKLVDASNPEVKHYLDVPKAEASHTECGALGMLYLKELLKDNAKQWSEFCLAVPYHPDRYDDIKYFFLPAPQLLRYSQSSMYNEIIKAMLSENVDHPVTLTRKKANGTQEQHQVQPIALVLAKTLAFCADKPQYKKITEDCKAMLLQLPEFRKKWLSAYDEAMSRRKDMDDVKEINRYLSFKSMKMQKKV